MKRSSEQTENLGKVISNKIINKHRDKNYLSAGGKYKIWLLPCVRLLFLF